MAFVVLNSLVGIILASFMPVAGTVISGIFVFDLRKSTLCSCYLFEILNLMKLEHLCCNCYSFERIIVHW